MRRISRVRKEIVLFILYANEEQIIRGAYNIIISSGPDPGGSGRAHTTRIYFFALLIRRDRVRFIARIFIKIYNARERPREF